MSANGLDPASVGPVAVLPWLARLLHTADSFYPTGSYAHSFGLEGLAHDQVVRDRDSLRTFLIEHALPALAWTDLPIAARAFRAVATDPVDWAGLRELCLLGAAVRGTREIRQASEAIGQQRLELAALLHPRIAREFKERAGAGNWPRPSCVIAAVEGRSIGAPRDAVLAAIVYAAAAGFISAAVKLLRLGQNALHTLLSETLELAPDLIDQALRVEDDEIGTFNPWWDMASARHETADFRLFIS